MATEKWTSPSAWSANISSTELNGVPTTDAVALATVIDNTTNLDMFLDISIALASAAWASPYRVDIYLYPLNQDGTTYGDGRFASAAAGPPPSNYFAGSIGLNPTASIAQEGTLTGIVIGPTKYQVVFMNNTGVTLGSSNTVKYRTYDRSVA